MEGIDKPNTQKVLNRLQKVADLKDKTLLVLKEPDMNATLSLRNVNKLDILYSNTLNVKDILIAKNIIIAEDALENIQKTYHD
jgi:ribosomal protein L4